MTARSLAATLAVLAIASPSIAQRGLPEEPAPGRGAVHVIEGCTVGMTSKIDLPATEAGVLTYVGVKRGARFSAEDILAKVDAREAELAKVRAQREYELALHRQKQTIELEYAQASELVERAEYEDVLAVRRRVPDGVTTFELRKEELEWRRAQLGAEKAVEDLKAYKLEAAVKKAELDATEMAIEKSQIRAPFKGEVLELHREQGEWVQPGDVIAEVAQLDTLLVDGKVYFDEYSQIDLQDCRVTVEVPVGRDRTVEATGWITYIDPVAQYAGDRRRYTVRAEIANREEKGRWLISPNMGATMRIHLGTADEAQVGDRTPQTRLAK